MKYIFDPATIIFDISVNFLNSAFYILSVIET